MASDSFNGDFMEELIWRFSSNLIDHVLFIKTPEKLQTNFILKSP